MQENSYNNVYIEGSGIAQSALRGAIGWAAGVRFPAGARHFYLLYSVHTGSGTHPASYPLAIGGSFPGSKMAGA
jgi:hypothetical protein